METRNKKTIFYLGILYTLSLGVLGVSTFLALFKWSLTAWYLNVYIYLAIFSSYVNYRAVDKASNLIHYDI